MKQSKNKLTLNLSIFEAIRLASNDLKKSRIPNPTHEAHLILNLCLPKNSLFYPRGLKLSKLQTQKFQKLITLRNQNVPFAYLTGFITFCNNKIIVNKNVLIPRPETEQLIDLIIKNTSTNQFYSIADIGTGSGAIAVTLAKFLPKSKIIASDISKKALDVAQKNINLHKLNSQITSFQSDLLTKFKPCSLDIIVANLPYIPSISIPELSKDITSSEPTLALDGGDDGLLFIKNLLKQSKNILKPDSQIFLEIWHTHPDKLKKITYSIFPKAKIKFRNDLSNLARFAIINI